MPVSATIPRALSNVSMSKSPHSASMAFSKLNGMHQILIISFKVPLLKERDSGVPSETAIYAKAVQYIQDYLDQGHRHDDMVTWYNLHPV